MKVAIVGATGETGSSIVEGLRNSKDRQYEIRALVRPTSLAKSKVQTFRDQGIEVMPTDLTGSQRDLARSLDGMEVVISAIGPFSIEAQKSLADAAKTAGVKRFVPCFFATIAPPRGVLGLREKKEDVLNYIQKIFLPYTVIDVGWWHQLAVPRVPSGRFDYGLIMPCDYIVGDGNVLSALTNKDDVGNYTARIVADPRTLNRKVFAYTALYTQNQIYDLVEAMTGEHITRDYITKERLENILADAGELDDILLSKYEYQHSWGIRGDNQPQYAKYLGYLTSESLYPDLPGQSLEDYCRQLLNGTARKPYHDHAL